MSPQAPSLSIIIPTLNEAENLPRLLHDLSRQNTIQFETIVVDGGSTDNTRSLCDNFADRRRISLQVLSSPAGRGMQMNHGVKTASADDYLFLHADTHIKDPLLLFNAQQFITHARRQSPNGHIAGHFPLRFISQGNEHQYYFYESKTHLNRPDTINGDQGFWIARPYFKWLGGFDESLPYMEDARLAQKIFKTGQWITLPGKVETLARRFETEGFAKRQILNSFLCNFNYMGVNEFFTSASDAYRAQNNATTLQLRPFLKLAHRQIWANGFITAFKRWYQTGAYVANNAWQLAFAFDCKRGRKRGLAPGTIDARSLNFYDQHIAHIIDWPVIKFITALITITWFYSLFLLR